MSLNATTIEEKGRPDDENRSLIPGTVTEGTNTEPQEESIQDFTEQLVKLQHELSVSTLSIT